MNQNKSKRNARANGEGGDDLKHKGLLFNTGHLGLEFGLVETLAFVACPVSVFHVVHLVNTIPQFLKKSRGFFKKSKKSFSGFA